MKKLILFPAVLAGMMLVGASQSEPAQLMRNERLDKFVADYLDMNSYTPAGSALNVQICEEGMVLLKNKDNVLPLKDVHKISVFGKASTKMQKGGGGSGSSQNKGEDEYDLQRSLEEVGYELNPKLTAFYKDDGKSGRGRSTPTSYDGTGYNTIGETPIDNYTDEIKASYDEYNDAAIILIARAGTEGADCKTCDARDFDSDPFSHKHYLRLSNNEEAMFAMVKEKFNKIIVLINSGNIFQCDQFENDDKISAVMWVGTPGFVGAKAIGRILSGQVNPSGRTVDTWTRNFENDPTFQNFSDNAQTQLVKVGEEEVYLPHDTMLDPDGKPILSQGTDAKYTDKNNPRWEGDANSGINKYPGGKATGEQYKVVKGGINGVRPASYVSYEEGVYVDYRYYETRYADKEAESKGSGDEWYRGEYGVIYPFGYGLSYTSFKQEFVSMAPAQGNAFNASTDEIKITVKVTNTGSVAGKDVVQLYWKAPYKSGEIEKPYEILCAFAKTKELAPGESQNVKLSFHLQDQANYDAFDKNNNGFKGYELDGGEYRISLNKNAHEMYQEIIVHVQDEGIKYENDRYTGHKVENHFSGNDFYSSIPLENDVEFTQLTRSNWEGTMPKSPSFTDRTVKSGSRVEEFYNHPFSVAELEMGNYEYVPQAAYRSKADIEQLGWTQQKSTLAKSNRMQLSEMIGYDMDDPKWDTFLNQFTYSELQLFVQDGCFHSPKLDAIGKPQTDDSDGPSQYARIGWAGAPLVAATYNVELAHKQGEMVGTEAHLSTGGGWGWGGGSSEKGKYGWFGPAVNTHRSPFGGRNFEYYSADPFLMGRMCAQVVGAAQDKGVYCYFKHFAVNDQEKGREGISTFVTEQALREIYLRSFQMVVQEGHASGIMSSYNRLGLMETAASYPLLTQVLREEWGFKGAVLSDMTHNNDDRENQKMYENVNNRVLAGCNAQLDNTQYDRRIECTWDSTGFDGKGCPVVSITENGQTRKIESYSWWYAVRKCAKETLWQYAHSGGMDQIMIQSTNDIKIAGAENGKLALEINKPVNVSVTLDNAGDKQLILDRFPLPEGLRFENGAIVGTPTKAGTYMVTFLASNNNGPQAGQIVYIEVYNNPEESAVTIAGEKNSDKKKGCFGELSATASILGLSLVASLFAGYVLLRNTRKKEEE